MSDYVEKTKKAAQQISEKLSSKFAEKLIDAATLVQTLKSVENYSPDVRLKLFGLTQVPLLFLAQPKVMRLDSNGCEIRLNLNFVNKNHLSSMYFGAQAIGADTAVGLLAMDKARAHTDVKVVPVFKNFKANFLKRAEGDLLFVCEAGEQVGRMVDVAANTGERVTEEVTAVARLLETGEVVSEFSLGLSVRAKKN